MVAGINKPFSQNPNSFFSRIENNSELHYIEKKYQSYLILPAIGLLVQWAPDQVEPLSWVFCDSE